MTQNERETVTKLRNNGYGYIRISKMVGVSVNTVKSFCRRNCMTQDTVVRIPLVLGEGLTEPHFCRNCGIEVVQIPGRKEKKFCSDRCRNLWWNRNLDKVQRKAVYVIQCKNCGKTFSVYGNANRKYCCHECFISDRFGGVCA